MTRRRSQSLTSPGSGLPVSSRQLRSVKVNMTLQAANCYPDRPVDQGKFERDFCVSSRKLPELPRPLFPLEKALYLRDPLSQSSSRGSHILCCLQKVALLNLQRPLWGARDCELQIRWVSHGQSSSRIRCTTTTIFVYGESVSRSARRHSA